MNVGKQLCVGKREQANPKLQVAGSAVHENATE